MKSFLVLIVLITGLFLFGCLSPAIEAPSEEGIDCKNNVDCIVENLESCQKAFGTIIDGNNEIYLQILNPVGEKCHVYIKLNKSDTLPEMLFGLDAKCNINLIDLFNMQEDLDIRQLDCNGPLFDMAVNAKNLGLVQ